jgi:hypothetical protein
MATLIILTLIGAALFVFIGWITANAPSVEPYAADIKKLSFWLFVIALAGAVFHKVL